MNEASPHSYPVVEFFISDKKQENKIKICSLVTDVITAAPLTTPSSSTNKQMKKLGLLAAESCSGLTEVGILIGVDYFWQIVKGSNVQLGRELYAVSTIFGWMPVGLQYGEGEFVYQNSAIVNFSCVQDSLRSLWDLDFMCLSENSAISNEEKEMIECFERGIRLEGDRYSVGLLWKSEMGQLENNFEVALRRFKNLRNRLNRYPEIFQQYKNVIEEQINEGIVEECSQEITESSYFMPHREIIKPNETTSCRIVYDASSSRSKGVNSLNDILDVGPNLSPLVLYMILKFRKFEIAFSGDIAKAFLMIGISEKDRDYLKFLWFGDNEQGYKTLRFKRLPFGLCCSPAILAMTIKYHIKKYKSVNPECFEMLNSSLYVDDLYYGSDTIEDACRLSTDAVNIFKDAGMDLRKLSLIARNLIPCGLRKAIKWD
ncbi:hypothetical protein AVEN_106770-1 [Araneus ventricosus]|uniref:Reverse transcriptase domain-containing protein n=1 Tax=Araneus ventricosus TaxID=182803 RepID=A0A4Y2F5E4_ARAVE|nr:hypothetical protein AVEN_106770-1 [Araneus ventricosus]